MEFESDVLFYIDVSVIPRVHAKMMLNLNFEIRIDSIDE